MKIKIILIAISFLCTYQPVKAAANSTDTGSAEVSIIYAIAIPSVIICGCLCMALKQIAKGPYVSVARPAPAVVSQPPAADVVVQPPSYESIDRKPSALPPYSEAGSV